MLWMPFNFKNKYLMFILNAGIGCCLISCLHPDYLINYEVLDISYKINGVATIKILFIASMFLIIFSLFFITRAITSRDYAWIINLLPTENRLASSGYIHSYAYAIIKLPRIITEANISILSRGLYLPFSIKWNINRTDLFGLWMLFIIRECKEMALTIEYVLTSKIKPQTRVTPIARHFSPNDYNILSIVICILFLRVMDLVKFYF